MNRALAGTIAGVLVVAFLTAGVVGMYRHVDYRIELAHSWSNDDFNFTATGDRSTVLTVDPLGYGDQKPLACSLFVGSVTNDAKLSGELAGAGFTKIQCGELIADLK